MSQPQLKRNYVVMTVSCGHCQQEQIVHVLAGAGIWSRAHQSVECLRCGQHFEVMLPDAIIGGPFLPRDISSAQQARRPLGLGPPSSHESS
jgi:ribosomal protein S27E